MDSKTCSTEGCDRAVLARSWCYLCYHRQYRNTHLEESRERNRRYCESHREQIRKRERQRYEAHLEQERESARQYRASYPERVRLKAHRWYETHPEKSRENVRQYRQKHPDRVRADKQRRRAREANAQGAFTAEEWRELCDRYGNRCLCCGLGFQLHADHVIPLSKGGSNDISNLQLLCRSCNSRKGTKSTDYR